ncbi:MAG: DUF4190 domain-containing protein [Pseudonocardiaceae bacterium]
MSAPAQQYGSSAPAPHASQQSPKNGLGTAGFVLGLLSALFAMIPIIGMIAWPMAILGLIFGIVGVSRVRQGVATNKGLSIAGTVLAAIGLVICIAWAAALGSAAQEVSAELDRSGPAPAAPQLPGGGSGDATVPFGQVWTSSNGNTVVAGAPETGISESPMETGESVIRVPVTLTNNGQDEWSPVLTTFGGTLNGAPVQEAMGEGDWMYSTPIAPGASVTLTKVFLGGTGDFTLTVSTPHGVAFFTGQV